MLSLSKKEKRASLLFLLIYFFAGNVLFSICFSFLIKTFHIQLNIELTEVYFNFFYDLLLMVYGLYIYRRFLINDLKNQKGKLFWNILWAVTIGFIVLFIANFVSGLLVQKFSSQTTSSNQEAVLSLLKVSPRLMIITATILAPVLEELVFRVGIFANIYEKNHFLAYFTSSFAFGLVHVLNGLLAKDFSQLIFIIPYGLLGFVICLVYQKKKTIVVPVLMHGMNNLVSTLIALLV